MLFKKRIYIYDIIKQDNNCDNRFHFIVQVWHIYTVGLLQDTFFYIFNLQHDEMFIFYNVYKKNYYYVQCV